MRILLADHQLLVRQGLRALLERSGLRNVAEAGDTDGAVEAARQAINSPLLDFSMKGSQGVIFNASGDMLTLNEIQQAAKVITEHADPKAQIIFGATKDSSLKKGEIKITVIATKLR